MIIDIESLAERMASVANAMSRSSTGSAPDSDLILIESDLDELLDLLRNIDDHGDLKSDERDLIRKLFAVYKFVMKVKTERGESDSTPANAVPWCHPDTPNRILGLHAASRALKKNMLIKEREAMALSIIGAAGKITGEKIVAEFLSRYGKTVDFDGLRGRELRRLKLFGWICNDNDHKGYYISPGVTVPS